MALPINKTLQGAQTLVNGNTYQLQLPVNNAPRQNALSEYNLEECYIDCDTANGGLEIILPSIASFGGDRSVKIYICNTGGNAVNVYGFYQAPTPSLSEIDNSINGVLGSSGSVTVQTTETGWFQIVSNNNWAYFCTPVAP